MAERVECIKFQSSGPSLRKPTFLLAHRHRAGGRFARRKRNEASLSGDELNPDPLHRDHGFCLWTKFYPYGFRAGARAIRCSRCEHSLSSLVTAFYWRGSWKQPPIKRKENVQKVKTDSFFLLLLETKWAFIILTENKVPSTRIRFSLKTDIFFSPVWPTVKNALQSGDFWKRLLLVHVCTEENGGFFNTMMSYIISY